MTPEKAYEKFIVKINKNAQTNNISCDRGRFVLLYNESQNKEVEFIIEHKNGDDLRYIEKLLVPDKLRNGKKEENCQIFALPKDYFDLVSIRGRANSECCKDILIYDMFEIMPHNENEVVFDEYNEPSLEWRSAPYYLYSNNIKAYRSDFEYTEIDINYYRYAVQISLEDEDNPESKFSKNLIELDDKIADRIISRAASEFELNNNSQKYQADMQRAIAK